MIPPDERPDAAFMRAAIKEAEKALAEGEVPIGAVAVKGGTIAARGHNRRRALSDITAHAEMMCLRDLSPQLDNMDLGDITIYSTLEPCTMCAGAMIHYGVKRVVYGARDIKLGAAGSAFDILNVADIEITSGVLGSECRRILLDFFERELGQPSNSWEDIAVA
jgi:tRNA(adenine34) deaminase